MPQQSFIRSYLNIREIAINQEVILNFGLNYYYLQHICCIRWFRESKSTFKRDKELRITMQTGIWQLSQAKYFPKGDPKRPNIRFGSKFPSFKCFWWHPPPGEGYLQIKVVLWRYVNLSQQNSWYRILVVHFHYKNIPVLFWCIPLVLPAVLLAQSHWFWLLVSGLIKYSLRLCPRGQLSSTPSKPLPQ